MQSEAKMPRRSFRCMLGRHKWGEGVIPFGETQERYCVRAHCPGRRVELRKRVAR